MAIRFVRGAGNVVDPAAFSFAASGVIRPNQPVDRFGSNGTGGAVVTPTTSSSTTTMIFGAGMSYAQGASDTYVNVIPFSRDQLWEVDCANAATTAQLGIRHAWSADRGVVHNTATDIGANAVKATRMTAIFEALAMTSLTTGSGKLIGRFLPDAGPVVADAQT